MPLLKQTIADVPTQAAAQIDEEEAASRAKAEAAAAAAAAAEGAKVQFVC